METPAPGEDVMQSMCPRTVLSVAALSVTLTLLLPDAAWAAAPVPVLDSPVNEAGAAAEGEYLAWDQNSQANPGHFDVFAKKRGRHRFKVNAAGTQAFMGGISGSRLVYQQVRADGTDSDIYLFNLSTRHRTRLGNPVNTTAWEYEPSIDGNHILFARLMQAGTRKALLFDTATDRLTLLDRTTVDRYDLRVGQVNGEFAVWQKCAPVCNVFERVISAQQTTRLANPHRKQQYGPSVADDGTAFFARSGRNCGSNVRFVRDPLVAAQETVVTLPDGVDVDTTYARDDAPGKATVFFDRIRCRGYRYDVYRFTSSAA